MHLVLTWPLALVIAEAAGIFGIHHNACNGLTGGGINYGNVLCIDGIVLCNDG